MPEEPAIFISYRRRDAGGHGRALHEYLSGRFGDDRVFFDRSTIESGDVFPDKLRRGVEGCAALLALIGPEWLDVRGEDGSRRLDDADDFVRREIALALERGKKVIPVLFDDTPVPLPDRLPDPLRALASCDALTLRGKTYEYQNQRRELVGLLAKVPGVPPPRMPDDDSRPPGNAIPLAEAFERFVDPRLIEALRQTRGRCEAAQAAVPPQQSWFDGAPLEAVEAWHEHPAVGAQAAARHELERADRAAAADFRARLLSGELLAWGREETAWGSWRAIPPDAWTVVNLRSGIVRGPKPAATRLYGVVVARRACRKRAKPSPPSPPGCPT